MIHYSKKSRPPTPEVTPEPIIEELEVTDTLETKDAVTETPTEINTAAQVKIESLEDTIKEQKEQIKQLKKIQTSNVIEEVVSEYEFGQDAKKFLKEHNDIEMQKRALVEKLKEIKESYKDVGVDIGATLKAQKTLIQELKEDAGTAQIIEQMKKEIKEDDRLMTDVTVFAG